MKNAALFVAPAGVTVFLDETGDMPRLVVSVLRGLKLSISFVRSCQDTARAHGATIEWRIT